MMTLARLYMTLTVSFLLILQTTSVQASSPVFSFNTSTIEFFLPSDNDSRTVNLSVPVVFLGRSYNKMFILKDGLVSFGQKLDFKRQDWSAPDVSSYIDIPFIAPYYYDAQSLVPIPDYTGAVIYQQFNAQQLVNTNLSQYIRSQVIGSGDFDADWAMQITWLNVTSSKQIQDGRCTGTYSNPCPVNTFQLVLATDGVTSYAIFNYGNMALPPEKYNQAGFNGGHGIGWTNVLTSGAGVDLVNRLQGSDTVGRYVFRISTGLIFRGGCSSDPNYDKLSIYPNYAGMWGEKMIDISGPCFNNNDVIMCRFGTPKPGEPQPPEVKAIYVSPTRVRCMVPRLLFRDRITLSLSLSGPSNYRYSAPLTIILPSRMPSEEKVRPIATTGLGFYGTDPSSLTLNWTGQLLSTNPNALVDIHLVGYNETNGTGRYHPLTTLVTNVRASAGTFTLNASSHQCVHQDCFNYEVGLLYVTLQDSFVPNKYKSLSSKVIPFGWWAEKAMRNKYGVNWPSEMCINWYNKDRLDMAWLQKLLHCPCSLTQSLADFGRWQPDVGCSISNIDDSDNCFYHKGAVHCVRAVQPVDGAGNQCCYGANGQLIFAADTVGGSTPDRSHDWGAAPYGVPGYVPSLSHWLTDVVTFYYCCIWTGYKSCDYYMDQRPTKDCAGYQPPALASVYGQGHVTPFAGPDYTYRVVAEGDYILYTDGNTTIQGRFRKNLFPTTEGNTITSVVSLVGVAIQDKGVSDRVELNLLGPQNNKTFQKIEVKVNEELVQFDEGALAWHDFKGVAVINTDRQRHVQANFTVILTNGIGLQVIEAASTLQMDVMVPPNQFSRMTGLFGDVNGVFRTKNGSSIDVKTLRSNINTLYSMFERNWAVRNKSDSLFQNFALSITHQIAEPTRIPGTVTATGICGHSMECSYDYYRTGSKSIAKATKQADERLNLLRQYLQPVRSCGLLNVSRAVKNTYNYTLGTTTTLTGCRVGSLSGPSTYTCQATSNESQAWTPAVTSTCSGYSFNDAIAVNCSKASWDVSLNMTVLRSMYPSAKASDIYMGENSCNGKEYNGVIRFQRGLDQCLTSQTMLNGNLVYRNELVYAQHDPIHPFIIRSFNWTVPVECQIDKLGITHGHVLHTTPKAPQGSGIKNYTVSMKFYEDPNYMIELKGNPLSVPVGTQVYVKVFTRTADWGVKMIVDTCYTKPAIDAQDYLKLEIIKHGCEVDTNTHLIAQTAHETRLVFQEFAYTTSHEGIFLFCDAIFCDINDHSDRCSQTCHPGV